MKLLAIETAFEACSVALHLDGECLERYAVTPRGHAATLLPWVEELLAQAQLSLSGLDAIAFSQGPGSFTSLRIGISVVQGLAFGADLPVAPVSSLRAMVQAQDPDQQQRTLVVMDARMQEVFAGDYTWRDGIAVAVSEDRLLLPARLTAPADEVWTALGNGFARFPELARLAENARALQVDAWPRAAAVALLAAHWLRNHPGLPAEAAEPVYLRDKVADKPREA
jgi:tRNA threonylcarbamoyladenosine biosynthesis protein TsaB